MQATSEADVHDADVHVSINNIPPKLRGGYWTGNTVQATQRDMSSSAPGPSRPTRISHQHSHALPLTAPAPSTRPLARHVTRVLILHDCATNKRFPTVEELLQLMDTYRPVVGMKYLDKLDSFQDMGLNDIVDVYSLPVELLANIGDTGRTAARRIHAYCDEKLLDPLRFMMSDSSEVSSASDGEVPDLGGGRLNREGKKRRILQWAKDVRAWEEGKEADVVPEERADTIVVTDDEEDGLVDVATYGCSQEV